jgi:hypothetical protein
VTIFYCLRFETSLFVASYDSHGYGGTVNTVYDSTSIVASAAAGNCLPSRCLEANVVAEPFASNSCFFGSTVLALSKYATVFLIWLDRTFIVKDLNILIFVAFTLLLSLSRHLPLSRHVLLLVQAKISISKVFF